MLAVHFRELVEELERDAQDNDGAYRLKVALLAALGYAYLVGVIALLAGALWLLWLVMKDRRHLVLLHVAISLALLGLLGFRAVWVRPGPPPGIPGKGGPPPQPFSALPQ